MQLVTVSQFRAGYFEPGSEPSARTVRRWITDGRLPGTRIDRDYYVDIDALRVRLAAPPIEQPDDIGNREIDALVASVLSETV